MASTVSIKSEESKPLNQQADQGSDSVQKEELVLKSNSSFKQFVKRVVTHTFFEIFIIFLIVLYVFLVFTNFALEDDSITTDAEVRRVGNQLKYLELSIVAIFSLEIVAKIYVFGMKKYFRDCWIVIDGMIIVVSIVLIILDIILDSQSFGVWSKITRGIFRFFRIFLLFRKVTQFKKINRIYSRYDLKTTIEKVIDVLTTAQDLCENRSMVKDLDWCMSTISSNTLYDPLLDALKTTGDKSKAEVMTWIESYSTQRRGSSPGKLTARRRKSGSNNNPSSNTTAVNGQKQLLVIVKGEREIPPNVLQLFGKLDELEFNTFELDQISNGQGLSLMIMHIFETQELMDKVNINANTLFSFIKKIQEGYKSNPYHNKIHASDVVQTVNFFLKKCKFGEIANLSDLDTVAMYLAAACHDFEHPGRTNAYLINTRDVLAMRYNDKSVLENHHVSASYVLMADANFNVFSRMSREEFSHIRERMIGMILATDMSAHFGDLARLKGRLSNTEFSPSSADKNICMEILIHASDISNPVKPFDIYNQWVERILQEYWSQGDSERSLGLPISYLCDRYTTNTSKSQIGFIDVIVQPTFEVIKSFLPELGNYLKNFDTNKNFFKEKVSFFDEALAKLKEEKERDEQAKQVQI